MSMWGPEASPPRIPRDNCLALSETHQVRVPAPPPCLSEHRRFTWKSLMTVECLLGARHGLQETELALAPGARSRGAGLGSGGKVKITGNKTSRKNTADAWEAPVRNGVVRSWQRARDLGPP